MSREVATGSVVIDIFSAYEADGYTKRSGLLPTDFEVIAYKDGSPIDIEAAVSEIVGSGDYRIQFTPEFHGVYKVTVYVKFNKDYFTETYTSSDGLTPLFLQIQKIDLAPTIGPASVVSGSLMDRMMNKDQSKTFNQATDSLQGIRDRMG